MVRSAADENSWSDPAENATAITPNDSTELSPVPRGIYVGTGGNLALLLVRDSVAVTFVNVPDGSIVPARALKVMSTNTTASDIVALY